MRTTKASTFLAQRESEIESEVRRISGELEKAQAELRLVRELRAFIAVTPKRKAAKVTDIKLKVRADGQPTSSEA